MSIVIAIGHEKQIIIMHLSDETINDYQNCCQSNDPLFYSGPGCSTLMLQVVQVIRTQ